MDYAGKRAWLYTNIDAPEDNNGSLKRQEKELFDYAEQLGLSIAGTSSDLGNSNDNDRPGMGQAIAAAEGGRFDVLLVRSSGRLCFDNEQIAGLIRQFGDMGVTVCSPIEGEIKLYSPMSIRMEGLT